MVFQNVGKFEFVINEWKTIVIPMKMGTIFTYSAYIMTHQQQIKKEPVETPPLVNVVDYNSKRLFSNMMELYQRVILANKESIAKKKQI